MAEERLPVAAGVVYAIEVPERAARVDPPPAGAWGESAGVVVRASVAYRAGGLELRAVCASASSDRWVTGAEDLVLGRATQLAREQTPDATSLDAGPIDTNARGFSQRFEGARVRGKHELTFAGDDALLCTTLCIGDGDACDPVLGRARFEGATHGPPPPGVLSRALFAALDHPSGALVILSLAAVAIAAIVIARRPKPRYPV